MLNDQLTAITKFQNHPNIIKSKSKFDFQEKVSFKPVPDYIPNNKAVGGEEPLHILIQSGFTYKILTDCINDALSRGIFPNSLKFENITSVHKKDEAADKDNYRPVSVLHLFSKIFEKVIYDQLSEHLEKHLNNLLCVFRKALSSQPALFKLLHAWQKELDKYGLVRKILMDLFKLYESLPHNLFVCKIRSLWY